MNNLFFIYSILFIILFVLFFSFLYMYNLYSDLKNKIVGGILQSTGDGYTFKTDNIPSITKTTSSMSIWLNIKNTNTDASSYIHIFCFSVDTEATMNINRDLVYSLNICKNTSFLSFCPYHTAQNIAEFNKNNLMITKDMPYDKWTNVFINITNNAIFEFYINGKLEQTYSIDKGINQNIINTPLNNCVMIKANNDLSNNIFDISVANFERWLYNQTPDQIMKIYNAGIGFQLQFWNAGITYLYDDKIIQRNNLF